MRGDTVDTDWLIGQLGNRLDFEQSDPELERQLIMNKLVKRS